MHHIVSRLPQVLSAFLLAGATGCCATGGPIQIPELAPLFGQHEFHGLTDAEVDAWETALVRAGQIVQSAEFRHQMASRTTWVLHEDDPMVHSTGEAITTALVNFGEHSHAPVRVECWDRWFGFLSRANAATVIETDDDGNVIQYVIKIDTGKFDIEPGREPSADMVKVLAHEYCHIVGFHHSGNLSGPNADTVPYVVGAIVHRLELDATTHQVIGRAPFYLHGPQQGSPPDGYLEVGTRVTALESTGDYVWVMDRRGNRCAVERRMLRKL